MTVEKTYFGFRIKNYWTGDINIYKLFSTEEEYTITFAGEIIGKVTLNGENPCENRLKIIYSRNMNIPETDIADIGVKIIETARSLN